MFSGRPAVPYLWTRYLKNVLKEFLQIWYKLSVGLTDEQIRFWWLNCKGYISQNTFWSCDYNITRRPAKALLGSETWYEFGYHRSRVCDLVYVWRKHLPWAAEACSNRAVIPLYSPFISCVFFLSHKAEVRERQIQRRNGFKPSQPGGHGFITWPLLH